MDYVELGGWVVVVEAEWLGRPPCPGTFSCPLGCSTRHVEVQIRIFTASQTVLLGSHELGDHPVVVISLLLVVQLSRAAAEGGVVVQDELEAALVGRVAVGAVVRLHGDLDQGRVADLRTAVCSTAARHVCPAVGVSSTTIFTDVVRRAVLAVVIGGIADSVGPGSRSPYS